MRSNKNGQFYALKKVTSTAFTQDLVKEADLLNQLRHQNIVAFVETFEEDGQFYVVLELCEGKFFLQLTG